MNDTELIAKLALLREEKTIVETGDVTDRVMAEIGRARGAEGGANLDGDGGGGLRHRGGGLDRGGAGMVVSVESVVGSEFGTSDGSDAMTNYGDAARTMLPKRKRWKTILLVLLVFFSGGIIGAAGATMYIVHEVRYAVHHPDEIPARLTVRLTHRLSLTPEQAQQVERLITQRIAHVKGIREEFQPKIRVELNGLHEDVGKVLTPEQQVKWDKLFDDFMDNWVPEAQSAASTQPGAGSGGD